VFTAISWLSSSHPVRYIHGWETVNQNKTKQRESRMCWQSEQNDLR
jgi:hypothetical protein